jgi:four helix bundle protein
METGRHDLRERTQDFALRIVRMYGALPQDQVARVLGGQVLRSGTSVGANYREADRARSKAEFIAKMGDCLKELDETDYWLVLLVRADVVPADRMAALIQETNELIAIFTTIFKHAKENAE